MSRVFLSHSSRDSRQAVAVKAWLIEQEPGLAEEIFLDLDPHTGIRPGERWRQALQQANTRCEAVICLLSKHWEASRECQTEFRYAENLGVAPEKHRRINIFQRCPPPIRGTVGVARRRPREMLGPDPQRAQSVQQPL